MRVHSTNNVIMRPMENPDGVGIISNGIANLYHDQDRGTAIYRTTWHPSGSMEDRDQDLHHQHRLSSRNRKQQKQQQPTPNFDHPDKLNHTPRYLDSLTSYAQALPNLSNPHCLDHYFHHHPYNHYRHYHHFSLCPGVSYGSHYSCYIRNMPDYHLHPPQSVTTGPAVAMGEEVTAKATTKGPDTDSEHYWSILNKPKLEKNI